MMFPHTVTLYNKYLEDGAEKWKRTVLKGVLWDSMEGAVLRNGGAASAAGVSVLIPRALPGYLKPKVWEAQAGREDVWTIQSGDRMVKGDIGLEIARSAAKELSGLDDVLAVTTVDVLDFGGLAHFEVSGK